MNGANLNNHNIIQNNVIQNIIGNNQEHNATRITAETLSAHSIVINAIVTEEIDSDADVVDLANNLRNDERLPIEFRNQIFSELDPNSTPRQQMNNLGLNTMNKMQAILTPNPILFNMDNVEELGMDEINIKLGTWIATQRTNDPAVLNDLSFHGAIFELTPNQHQMLQ